MRNFLQRCRQHFVHAGVFSFFINLFLLAVPLYTLQVFDRVFTSRSTETLVLMSLLAFVALSAMGALDVLRARLLLGAGVVLDRSLGPRVIAGLLADTPFGAGSAASLRDVAVLRAYLTGPGIIALFDAPWAPLFVLLTFLFHPLLGVIAVAGAFVLFGLAWLNERLGRGPNEAMARSGQSAGRFISASLRNAESVRALGMADAVTERWQRQNDTVIAAQLDAGRSASLITGVTRFTRLFIQTLALAVGAWLVIHQQISPGAMMATTLVLARALQPVESAIATWRSLLDARGAYRRLDELLGRESAATSTVVLPAPDGRLSVESVLLQLARGEQPVLKGVTFELAAGEALGIIGPSGAGKSSIARVITGVWKPTSGVARLDGADIGSWNRADLAPWLGYLPQAVELFPGTVGENIARLTEDKSEAIVEAAQRAHCHDMILRLSKGYDTEVGEGGHLLPAGQRQRIALARALYGSPRLVVLDEPNSNLDGEGEEALIRTLAGLKQAGVTICVVSHKPSLLGGMDKLLVLNAGRVEQFGPRAEVLARVTRAVPGAVPLTRGPQIVSGGADGSA